MAVFSRLEDLPVELFSEIAASFPLHSAPPSLLSLTLLNRAFYEVFYPILYSQMILRNEEDTQRTIAKILKKPELGQYIKGLHILSDFSRRTRNGYGTDPLLFDAIRGLEKLVSGGLLPNLGALSLHLLTGWRGYQPKGFGKLTATFWSTLVRNSPHIRSVVVSGLEDIALAPWIVDSGIYELREFKHLEKIGLSFFVSQTGREGFETMKGHFCDLSSSLNTLSLDFDDINTSQPFVAPTSVLHFPNLRSLTLSSFRVSDTAEAMLFWDRHPYLERLNLSSTTTGSYWFAEDIPVGILPNLRYLEANYRDILRLAPILHQLERLCIWQSSFTDVPHLLHSVLPAGLPRLKSIEIQVSFLRFGTSDSARFRKSFTDYIQSIATGAPNLKEMGIHNRIMSAELFFDALCYDDEVSGGFEHLERLYISYLDGEHFLSGRDRRHFFDGAFKLAQKGRFKKLESVTNFSSRYQSPYPVARITRNDEGGLKFLDAGQGFGMEIGYEAHPFPGIPGSG